MDRQWFNNAIEKMDFVIELLPQHLDPKKLPIGVREINYKFDVESVRWNLQQNQKIKNMPLKRTFKRNSKKN